MGDLTKNNKFVMVTDSELKILKKSKYNQTYIVTENASFSSFISKYFQSIISTITYST